MPLLVSLCVSYFLRSILVKENKIHYTMDEGGKNNTRVENTRSGNCTFCIRNGKLYTLRDL